MAKSTNQSQASQGQSEQLAEAVSCLADEVKVLREAIDELRSAIRWGLQNDKFRSPENPTIEPVEIDHEQIDATVRDACSELSGEVSDAVRESLKEEMREMRDSLDQFSIDAQWAARKIREKPTEELTELRETLQGEIVDLRGSVEQFMTEMQDAVIQIREAVRHEKQGTLFDPCVADLPQGK